LGKPYKVGPGRYGPDYYDCSGLTYAAAKAAGVTIGTVSYDQANDGTAVPMDPAYVRPGDLIIMNSTLEAPPWAHNGHVGMAVSSTEMIVAPHTGDVVKREPIPFGNKMILSDIRRIFQ
jgi:cell wall-associated NlpC family hydrolase